MAKKEQKTASAAEVLAACRERKSEYERLGMQDHPEYQKIVEQIQKAEEG